MDSRKRDNPRFIYGARWWILLGSLCLLIMTSGCQLIDPSEISSDEIQTNATSKETSRPYDRMDLSHMYATPEEWKKAFNRLKNDVAALSHTTETLENTLTGNGERLIEALRQRENIDRQFDCLSVYAMLYRDMDFSNEEGNTLFQMVENERGDVTLSVTQFDDTLSRISKKKLAQLIKQWEPSDQKDWIESVIASDYIPNKETNRIRSASQSILGSPENIFTAYLYLKEETGMGETGDYYSKDEKKRKLAYDAEKRKVLEGQEVMATTLSSEVAMNVFEARSYGYDRALEMYLDQDNLSEDAYRQIMNRPFAHRSTYQAYLDHLRKQMDLEVAHYYDRSMEPSFMVSPFPIKDIRGLLDEVLSPLGKDYTQVVNQAFDGKWLDLGGREHKVDGAYTLTAYDSHPYIVMTYQEDLSSAATLAHELGHLVNDVMTNAKQTYQNATITSIKAEMASTTNEVLLYDFLLNQTTDVEARKGILKAYIDFINDAYFYQTALARFQDRIHNDYASNQALTADYFNKVMGEELTQLYGQAYEVMDYDKLAWADTNHLYWGYYVYKYPLGAAVAFHNAEKIENKDQKFIKQYKDFLSSGSQKTLEEDLNGIGIDLSKEDYFQSIEKKYDVLVKEYISLTQK